MIVPIKSSKCPYGVKGCQVDEACENCQGEVICPKCGKKKLIPRNRKVCFECWRFEMFHYNYSKWNIVFAFMLGWIMATLFSFWLFTTYSGCILK